MLKITVPTYKITEQFEHMDTDSHPTIQMKADLDPHPWICWNSFWIKNIKCAGSVGSLCFWPPGSRSFHQQVKKIIEEKLDFCCLVTFL